MSFVGTRPEVVKYVEKYKPEYMATLLLPAGITSEARGIVKCVSACFWIWLFVTQNFAQKPIFYCLIFLGYTCSAFEEVEVPFISI